MTGVWFDSRDVESYLRHRGLHIRGSAAVAEMDIEAVPSPQGEVPLGDAWDTGRPPAATSPWKRRVTVDVERLMSLLNVTVVCLGRGSGYRPADVDFALNRALLDSW